jgi:hypothetical protein
MTKETIEFISTNLGNWALVVIAIAISVIAIKIVVTFDLNKYLESRKRRHLALSQNACPHMSIELTKTNKDGQEKIKYHPWFESPPMTTQWICKRCKLVVNNVDDRQLERAAHYYVNNPKAYAKTMRKSDKHITRAF